MTLSTGSGGTGGSTRYCNGVVGSGAPAGRIRGVETSSRNAATEWLIRPDVAEDVVAERDVGEVDDDVCKRGKRTIVWLVPNAGSFEVAFIFGEKALTAIRQTAVPARVLRMLDEAPKYREGTGLRFQIRAAKDIAVVKKLTAIKLQH